MSLREFRLILKKIIHIYFVFSDDPNYSSKIEVINILLCFYTVEDLKLISKELSMKRISKLNEFSLGISIIMEIYKLDINQKSSSIIGAGLLTRRPTISKQLRKEVWALVNGQDEYGNCFVCAKILSKNNFECAHIIAHSLEGPTNINNLRPTCMKCNRRCATKNLFRFKKEYNLEEQKKYD